MIARIPSRKRLSLLGVMAASLGGMAHGEIIPHPLFTDHAVLQRGVPLPFWGRASAGERVTVSFAGQTLNTQADQEGNWMVRLSPMDASPAPREMILAGQGNSVRLKDLLVGDVWLCGGQSNMEWPLAKTTDGRQIAARTREPLIRLFKVGKAQSAKPLAKPEGSWTPCDARNVASFSAVGFYFAKALRESIDVPVGLIGSHVGGTAADKWISGAALESHPRLRSIPKAAARAEASHDPEKAANAHRIAMDRYRKSSESLRAQGKPVPAPPAAPSDPRGRGPSSLYNGMIAPLQPFPLRGVIWYQGEANRGNPTQYADLFPTLIHDWRKAWKQPDLPFLFVQLPPFNAIPPEMREVQSQVWRDVPHTAMVVITDHGSATNIHPPVKEPVGRRLALAARSVAYGQAVVSSGPLFRSMTLRGKVAEIRFDHLGGGLTTPQGEDELRGFSIAGDDGKHLPAKAVIRGEMVEVSHPDIPSPRAVRFGWDRVPDVNLFNREGLPAVPFRTDSKSSTPTSKTSSP